MPRPHCLILTSLTLRASVDTMFAELGDGLRRQGVHTRVFVDAPECPNLPLVQSLIGDLRACDGPRFLIDGNGKSRLTAADAAGRPASIHDLWGIPRLSVCESHPIYHLDHLARVPINAAFTVVDEPHLEVFEAWGIRLRAAAFLPHGGPPPLPDPVPPGARRFDVLFVGNVRAMPPPREWLKATAPAEVPAAVVLAALDRFREETPSAIAALRTELAAAGVAPVPRRDLLLASEIEIYLNATRRREALAALAGLSVAVCGAIDGPLRSGADITRFGETTFAAALGLMEEARILLNFMPFRTGAHERVFYGLSRGAFIVSDYSTLLAPAVETGAGIAFLPTNLAGLSPALHRLLAGDLQAGVAAGRAWYRDRHSWDQRARRVLEIVEPLLRDDRS